MECEQSSIIFWNCDQDGNEVIRLANGQVLHLDVRDDIRENDEDQNIQHSVCALLVEGLKECEQLCHTKQVRGQHTELSYCEFHNPSYASSKNNCRCWQYYIDIIIIHTTLAKIPEYRRHALKLLRVCFLAIGTFTCEAFFSANMQFRGFSAQYILHCIYVQTHIF